MNRKDILVLIVVAGLGFASGCATERFHSKYSRGDSAEVSPKEGELVKASEAKCEAKELFLECMEAQDNNYAALEPCTFAALLQCGELKIPKSAGDASVGL